MTAPFQLETPRLVLRPLALGDVGTLRPLVIDPDVRRWILDGGVAPEAKVRSVIQRSIDGFRRRGAGFFALLAKEDGAFVGFAGLKEAKIGGLELGAAVWPRYARRGLAGEACRAILDDAFGRLGAARVVACTDALNVRSLALVARLGMRPLGITTPGTFGAIRWFALDRG